ncbi:MAG: SpoIIE family protein phosphatase [Gammaproteobacteria bacterium]
MIAFVNGIVLTALIASSLLLLEASRELTRINAIRYQSYLLADELRQSSDDLTRFARTYAVTGEPKWEKLYWETLAIRNGTQPRPDRYESVYWDIAAVDPSFRADGATTSVPLAKRMEQLGFSAEELAKLKEAEIHSNELVEIEKISMNAAKGIFMDDRGAFSLHGKPDPQLARRLMHDEAYHQAKVRIMRPISDAYDLLDGRTRRLVEAGTRRQDRLLDLTIVLIILSGLMTTISYRILSRRIIRPLSLLAAAAKRIGQQDTCNLLPVSSNDEVGHLAEAFNSVLGKMRDALAASDSAHKQIDASITYASLLQRALLPERKLPQVFGDGYFVLWQPRDKVGGDFYLFHGTPARYLIGIADCAGHGVPGAMMTMLARAAIDRAVDRLGVESPAAILSKTDEVMRAMLADAPTARAIATGMDVALAFVDHESRRLRFAGARLSLYWIDGDRVGELKGERRALADRNPGRYQDHEIALTDDRIYYLTTDGFLDQAGGTDGFGFGEDRFAAMLRDHAADSLEVQRAAFADILTRYRGDQAQRDDITVLCFRPI